MAVPTAIIEKAVTSQSGAITCPISRLYGNLPTTQIDLNRSVSALAC
jgi:hypothetical protein